MEISSAASMETWGQHRCRCFWGQTVVVFGNLLRWEGSGHTQPRHWSSTPRSETPTTPSSWSPRPPHHAAAPQACVPAVCTAVPLSRSTHPRFSHTVRNLETVTTVTFAMLRGPPNQRFVGSYDFKAAGSPCTTVSSVFNQSKL
jgi:hypothetical protein